MIAEVLAVGTELLMGQISNTNAQYISNRLPEVGIGVFYHTVVGDNPKRLKECLDIALKRSDVIIMTGGLGPTQDDLTKETVAEAFGRKLVLHEKSYETIKNFFSQLNRKMTDNNIKQAYLPEDSKIITNSNGTAPGCIIEEKTKIVIMLPGPPSEMKPMFEETVLPYLSKKTKSKIMSRFIRIFGVGESLLESKIIDIIEAQTNPTIAPYAKEGEVTLRVTANCLKNEEADELILPMIERIRERLGSAIYSIDDKNIEEEVVLALIDKNITLSVAESCTGGEIAFRITAIPGVSKIFKGGIVSYSNESKINILGVQSETIEKHGAVSCNTAIEMARRVRILNNTDLGIAVTGVAGPDGGTEEKPVGLVYIAMADENYTWCKEFAFWGSRSRIRHVTVLNAMNMIRHYLFYQEEIENSLIR